MTGILRASPALGKVATTQTGGKRMVTAWLGKPVLFRLYLNLCSALWLPRQMEHGTCWRVVPSCPDFQSAGRKMSRGSWDAAASLGSAARHCSFQVTLQGRQQPPCMPPSTLESLSCPGFKAGLTAFYSSGFFPFAYAYNHLLASQPFHIFFFLSLILFSFINYAFRATAYLLWRYLKLCYVFDKKLPACSTVWALWLLKTGEKSEDCTRSFSVQIIVAGRQEVPLSGTPQAGPQRACTRPFEIRK